MARTCSRPAAAGLTRTALLLALGLWLAVGAAAGARTLVSPRRHTVFPVFAAGATHWWADRSLYAPYPDLDHFRYPPAFALAVTPFGALGLRAGGILWTWFGMAVYGAGLWRFARDVLPRGWTQARTAAFLALAVLLALRGLWNAQSNALAVGLLLLAASHLVRRRWWPAAGLLAASLSIKLTPLPPALLLCALWPRRLAPRFALALAVAALVPFLTRPPEVVLEQYAEWVIYLGQSGSARWDGFRDGWTAWVVVRHLLQGRAGLPPLREPIDSAGYPALQLLSAAGTLAWCLWQRARGAGPRWLVQVTLGMGMAWLMLFGPAVEHATYAFLAPPLAWAAVERGAWRRGRWLPVAAVVLVAVLGWGALTRPLQGITPLVLACLPTGSALFACWLLGYAQSYGPQARRGPPAPAPPGDGARA
jgi:hypothetical protein